MKDSVNNQMIILAREARNMNQQELADKIKMSPTNLSKIERGDIGISKEVLESIASITAFPVHFFHQPGTIMPENLSYRRREKVAQKLITPINAKTNIIRKHIQFLTRAFHLSTPDLPIMEIKDKQSAATVATKIRRKWDIHPGPLENLTKVAEEQGIAIVHFPFGTERVDSRSMLTDDRYPIIYLNNTEPGDRLRFSLAYELGQLIMHQYTKLSPDRNIAHEASAFAAELLMPAKEIREDMKQGLSIALLADLKKKWKVSMISLLYRADDLDIITPNQKRYLVQQFNSLKIRRREPVELDITREEPKLVKRWIGQYRSKTGLTVMEMAALLCLHVDEFLEIYS